MKKIVVIVFLVLGVFSFSQEKENYKQAIQQFTKSYNIEDYQTIFEMFDANMKNALPLEKTKSFFKALYEDRGKIGIVQFIKTKNSAHIYKTTFDRGVRDILLYLNPQNKIGGLLISAHKPKNLPVLERNSIKMRLPFKEKWFVFWGGTTIEQNYHLAYENQKYAYDILMVKEGVSHKGDATKNENYFVFGKDIIAPCNATVASVIRGVKDNVPGKLNPKQLTGNTIVLKINKNEYLLFAHLKENSILVKEGQQVKQGELMAKCGNSGNTSEPHLHLSLQNHVDMELATGAKLYFSNILVNGKLKEEYLPVKEDFIQNLN